MKESTERTKNGGFGPDNNLPLDGGKVYNLRIPKFAKVELAFSSNAAWENAACIYDTKPVKIIEKGNHGRSLAPANLGGTINERTLIISGWHKKNPPDGGKPWFQSPVKVTLAEDGLSGSIGFEDKGDGDYDDMVVNFKFLPA